MNHTNKRTKYAIANFLTFAFLAFTIYYLFKGFYNQEDRENGDDLDYPNNEERDSTEHWFENTQFEESEPSAVFTGEENGERTGFNGERSEPKKTNYMKPFQYITGGLYYVAVILPTNMLNAFKNYIYPNSINN
ncbi:hypothetical protein NUSPORA_02215 [Nucleospora cyclopteri]